MCFDKADYYFGKAMKAYCQAYQKKEDALTGEDGEVESTQFTARVNGGRLEVTLTAQCLEEIGEERPGMRELSVE